MAKNTADFVVVLLLDVKEEGVDETLGPEERRHVMGHLARKLLGGAFDSQRIH
jgi:hypothetical protein